MKAFRRELENRFPTPSLWHTSGTNRWQPYLKKAEAYVKDVKRQVGHSLKKCVSPPIASRHAGKFSAMLSHAF